MKQRFRGVRFLVTGIVAGIAGVGVFSSARAGDSPQYAALADDVDVASCFSGADCPAFLEEAIESAAAACTDAGGLLRAAQAGAVWSLDIEWDGQNEYLVDVSAATVCDGAPSVLSCGSGGCPKTLYAHRDNGWQAIGHLFIEEPERLAALPSGELRFDRPGDEETWHYLLLDRRYTVSHLWIRGHRVEVAESIHGLYPLRRSTVVARTPSGADGERSYPAGTDVAIVGTTADGYYYVSPCNACPNGFISPSAILGP